jgi:hypothetical protein
MTESNSHERLVVITSILYRRYRMTMVKDQQATNGQDDNM